MKKICLFLIGFFYAAILTSCVPCNRCENLVDECWIKAICTLPHCWMIGTDSWFTTGEPNRIECCNMTAPEYRAISVTKVLVSNFQRIVSNGSYQLQIVGNQTRNSIYINGPNETAHKVTVSLRGKTLYINEIQDPHNPPTATPSSVIVKVGANNLASLTNQGSGDIYGKGIFSDHLEVYSTGSGNIFLGGKMNICSIETSGIGNVTIFGDYSPTIDIMNTGSGCINICGRVGIHTIKNVKMGRINIVGADSDSLSIFASGHSFTGISGHVNLKNISATEHSAVYLNCVKSNHIAVCGSDCARIGIAGITNMLTVQLQGGARFMGRYLAAGSAFVKTCGQSHANVKAFNDFLSLAGQSSSIYYFGTPQHISRLTDKNSVIISI